MVSIDWLGGGLIDWPWGLTLQQGITYVKWTGMHRSANPFQIQGEGGRIKRSSRLPGHNAVSSMMAIIGETWPGPGGGPPGDSSPPPGHIR